MTTLELDTMMREMAQRFLREEDTPLMQRVAKVLLDRVEKKVDADKEPETKEEILADFAEALCELKLAKEGKIKLRSVEDLLNEC